MTNHTFAARGVISIVISLPSSSLTGFLTHTVACLVAEMLKLRIGTALGAKAGIVAARAHRGSKNSSGLAAGRVVAWLRLATARKERAAEEALLQRIEAISGVRM